MPTNEIDYCYHTEEEFYRVLKPGDTLTVTIDGVQYEGTVRAGTGLFSGKQEGEQHEHCWRPRQQQRLPRPPG